MATDRSTLPAARRPVEATLGGTEGRRTSADPGEAIAVIAETAPDVVLLDVVPMIRAGALEYVTKTISTAELLAAIERVAAGSPPGFRSAPAPWESHFVPCCASCG